MQAYDKTGIDEILERIAAGIRLSAFEIMVLQHHLKHLTQGK